MAERDGPREVPGEDGERDRRDRLADRRREHHGIVASLRDPLVVTALVPAGGTSVLLVWPPPCPNIAAREQVSHPVQWVLASVTRTDARARAAERVAQHLRQQLPDDHIVLSRHAPRDGGERIPVVVVGRHGIFVIEPREEDGDLVCYQDHWYRRVGPGLAHPLSDPPSVRARRDRERVRSDLGTGGFLNVPIEALVLLTRGRPEDVRSSCVPVVAGVDALVRHLVHGISPTPRPEYTRDLARALAQNIKLTTS